MGKLTDMQCPLCGELGDIHKHRHPCGPDYVTCGDVMCELAPLPGIMLSAWNMLSRQMAPDAFPVYVRAYVHMDGDTNFNDGCGCGTTPLVVECFDEDPGPYIMDNGEPHPEQFTAVAPLQAIPAPAPDKGR